MIILDEPFVSQQLQDTIIANRILAMQRPGSLLTLDSRVCLSDPEEFFSLVKDVENPPIYTVSEDSLSIIMRNLGDSHLSKTIRLLKDKHATRMAMKALYPGFRFFECTLDSLTVAACINLGYPFILKPVSGICSIGVRKIASPEHLSATLAELRTIKMAQSLRPNGVVDFDRFIAEECIHGDEYAVDAFFKADGTAVIVNIIRHPFSHGDDVSDRLYYTSRKIVAELLPEVTKSLNDIGAACELVNVPVHLEFRRQTSGELIPIEINPLRFMGWCSAELSWHAFGINPHEAFLLGKEPDWDRILASCDDANYCLCCGFIPSHIDRRAVRKIDYAGFAKECGSVLELAKINCQRYPEFCYLFSKVDSQSDIERILNLKDDDFISMCR